MSARIPKHIQLDAKRSCLRVDIFVLLLIAFCSNTNKVWTYADYWLTYPHLPRQKKLLNAASGGWGGITGHHLWWMAHIPHNPGATDGFYNNWWQYIANYDDAIQKLPPPGATFRKAKVAMYAE